MLLEEFEARTGFFPSHDLYECIQEVYLESDLDKDAFCEMYKKNTDGLADSIARKVNTQYFSNVEEAKNTIAKLEQNLQALHQKLEKELEWRPYESRYNVTEQEYLKLLQAHGTTLMTDDAAIELVVSQFGFERSKISILHAVDKEEANRHGQVRKCGIVNRHPLYNASDWNYIRFSCARWEYEIVDGQLRPFYC